MKPTKVILAVAALFFTIAVNAQDKEIGIFLGAAQYQGDLTKKQITISETKPAVGILARYYFNPRIDIRGGLYYGQIAGDDKNYPDIENHERLYRNLSFKSHVIELSGMVELNILPFISNSKRYRFAPYVFGGLGVYHFNPKAEYNGKWYDLQPLGTEGQTLGVKAKYSRTQLSIPYGIGIKYSLGNFWNLSLEVGQRKLFTDYLDDVSGTYADYDALNAKDPIAAALSDRTREVSGVPSNKIYNKGLQGIQRGDKRDLDMYVFTGITISKTIRRFSCTGF